MNGLGIFGGRLLALLLALAMPSGPVAHYGHSAKNVVVLSPDSDVTPGVIRTTDASEICAGAAYVPYPEMEKLAR